MLLELVARVHCDCEGCTAGEKFSDGREIDCDHAKFQADAAEHFRSLGWGITVQANTCPEHTAALLLKRKPLEFVQDRWHDLVAGDYEITFHDGENRWHAKYKHDEFADGSIGHCIRACEKHYAQHPLA